MPKGHLQGMPISDGFYCLSIPVPDHAIKIPLTPTTDFDSNSSQVALVRKSKSDIRLEFRSDYRPPEFRSVNFRPSDERSSDIRSPDFKSEDVRLQDFGKEVETEFECIKLENSDGSVNSDLRLPRGRIFSYLDRILDRRVLNYLITTKELVLIFIDLFPFIGALWFMLMLLYNFVMNEASGKN